MAFDPKSIEHLNIYAPGNLRFVVDKASFNHATKKLDDLPKAIRGGYYDAVDEVGGHLAERIRDLMLSSDPSWKPLSQNTLRRYRRKGWGLTPWYRTGQMYSNVGVQVEATGDRLYIGLSQYYQYIEGTEGEDARKGMTIIQLAKMLEFGGGRNGKIPPRPLFSLVFKRYGGQKVLKERIIKRIYSHLKKTGWPTGSITIKL